MLPSSIKIKLREVVTGWFARGGEPIAENLNSLKGAAKMPAALQESGRPAARWLAGGSSSLRTAICGWQLADGSLPG